MNEYNDFLSHFNTKRPVAAENGTAADKVPSAEDSTGEARHFKSVTVNTAAEEAKDTPPLPSGGNKDGDESDSIKIASASRFIKAGATDFVAIHPVKEEPEEPTQVSKFTDRLIPRAPAEKVHTGYTGKINTYAANHSVTHSGEKQISAADKPASLAAEGESEVTEKAETAKPTENAALRKTDSTAPDTSFTDDYTDAGQESDNTAVFSPDKAAFGSQNNETEDIKINLNAPTKHIGGDEKGSLLRKLAGSAHEDIRSDPDQLMMDGFTADSHGDEDENKNEQALESELSKVREKRINSFHFWNKQDESDGENTDEGFIAPPPEHKKAAFVNKLSEKFAHLNSDFLHVDSEEFSDINTRKTVFATLMSVRRAALIKAIATGVLGIILLIINAAVSASAAANNGFFTIFGGNPKIFAAINLVFLLAGALLIAPDLKNGLFSLLKAQPKADTSILFLYTASLVQCITAFFTQLKAEDSFHLFVPAALVLSVPLLFAKLYYYDNTRQCFKTVGSKSDKAYLRRISDEQLVSEILRDGESAGANVVYAGKTKFIENFLSRSTKSAFASMPSSRAVILLICLSLAAGLGVSLVKMNFMTGITALCACAAFSFPVACLFSTGREIAAENKKLSVKAAFVQSYANARDFAAVDDILLDASELFDAQITNVITAKRVNTKQAQFCAAALTNKAGGSLSAAFLRTVPELADRFPEVEDITYEDKLGLSAWISNCRVLLGSNTLLVNHNVEMPSENAARSFLAQDEKPLYLAIEGHFTAMFAVKYTCKITTGELSAITESGTNLLLTTNDANISEEYAEQLLSLPENSVRVVAKATADKLTAARSAVTDAQDTGIVFSSSVDGLCQCAASALHLDSYKRISKLITEVGAFTGFALGAALSFSGSVGKTYAWMPLLLQALWLVSAVVAPKLFTGKTKGKNSHPLRVARGLSVKNKAGHSEAAPEEEPENAQESNEEVAENTSSAAAAAQDRKQVIKPQAEKSVPSVHKPVSEPVTPGITEAELAAFEKKEYIDEAYATLYPDNRKKNTKQPLAAAPEDNTAQGSEYEADDKTSGNGILAGIKAAFSDMFTARHTIPDGSYNDFDDEDSEDDEEDDFGSRNAQSSPVSASGGTRKGSALTSRARSFLSGGKNDEAEDEENGSPAARNSTGESYGDASLPPEERAILSESSVQRKQARDASRLSMPEMYSPDFSEPQMPPPPKYTLRKPSDKPEKDPLSERFVPPEAQPTISVYDDAFFSRYEDDNIFAGLKESEQRRFEF